MIHLWKVRMLDTISLYLKFHKEVARVFQSPHQQSQLVEVRYLIAGMLALQFIYLLPREAVVTILGFTLSGWSISLLVLAYSNLLFSFVFLF